MEGGDGGLLDEGRGRRLEDADRHGCRAGWVLREERKRTDELRSRETPLAAMAVPSRDYIVDARIPPGLSSRDGDFFPSFLRSPLLAQDLADEE